MTNDLTTAREFLRQSVEKRIASLNPGQVRSFDSKQMSPTREANVMRWAEIHLRGVLDEGLEAMTKLESSNAGDVSRCPTCQHADHAGYACEVGHFNAGPTEVCWCDSRPRLGVEK